MTTLISWSTSGGEKGRCDAKCYNATGPYCDCICGGSNHGVGLDAAIENTREMAEKMIETFSTTLEQAAEFQAIVNQDIFQLQLPGF